jgi:hypothetical protein
VFEAFSSSFSPSRFICFAGVPKRIFTSRLEWQNGVIYLHSQRLTKPFVKIQNFSSV